MQGRVFRGGMWLLLGLVAVLACEPGPKPAEWTLAGLNLSNTRHQESERVLSRRNVSGLKPRWVFSAAGSISATPAVEAGAVYFPDWGGKLWKLEERSGRVLWSHTISEYTGVPDSVSRVTPAVVGNRLILGSQQGGYLIALDKHSGELLWKAQVDPHPAAVITQSPIVHNGRVYVGVSSMEEAFTADPSYVCCTFRGSVVAVDLATGERRWQAYMVPEGYSGGAVWSNTLVVDTKRNSLYVTTGNNYEVPDAVEDCIESSPLEAAESCLAVDDYIDAFVSLDLDSGAVKWGRRLQGFDAWNFACSLNPQPWCPSPVGPDYDFGQGVMLFSGESITWGSWSALDAATGEIIWQKADPQESMPMGPVTVANGVVYAGSLDPEGHMYALDARTGETLWDFTAGGSVNAGAAVVDGSVYWGSGYGRFGMGTANDKFFAFSLE